MHSCKSRHCLCNQRSRHTDWSSISVPIGRLMIGQAVRAGIVSCLFVYSIAIFEEHFCTAFQCFLVQRILQTPGFCIMECLYKDFFLRLCQFNQGIYCLRGSLSLKLITKWNFDDFEITNKNLTDSQRDRRSLENKQTNKQTKQTTKQTNQTKNKQER